MNNKACDSINNTTNCICKDMITKLCAGIVYLFLLLGTFPAFAVTNVYRIDREFRATTNDLETASVYEIIYAANTNLTGIIRKNDFAFTTNSAIEYDAVSWACTNFTEAWNGALSVYSNNTTCYSNMFNDPGWIKGVKSVFTNDDGAYGAYLWILQNSLSFNTSTSIFFKVTTNSSHTYMINKVLIGTLGDYEPNTNYSETFPEMNEFHAEYTNCTYLTNSIPSEGSPQTVEYSFDTNAYYELINCQITNIKFNHDTASSASDAINIRQDYNTPFDISNGEWVKGVTNIPVCYTTNKTLTIKARFTVQPASITNADIWAVSTDTNGSLGDVVKTNVTFISGIASDVVFQVSGTTPGCIQKTTNDVWQWKMENVNGTGSPSLDLNTSGTHTVYTILNEPVEPWDNTAGNALNVWTRILNKSCLWANGCVTGSTVLSNIVTHSYSMGVVYDGYPHYTYPGYTQFHLQALLDAMDTAGTDNMDCRDFANWTHTLSGALGESAQYRVVTRTTSPYYFTYNYILPSGQSDWNTNNWSFHQVGWWNSRVCDAAAKLDNDADPTQGPGNSNHVEKLSVGDMTQTEYLDKLTETPDVTDIETGTCVLQ